MARKECNKPPTEEQIKMRLPPPPPPLLNTHIKKRGRPPGERQEAFKQINYIGKNFFYTLDKILNNEYWDGWDFINVYTTGANEYSILYKRIKGR